MELFLNHSRIWKARGPTIFDADKKITRFFSFLNPLGNRSFFQGTILLANQLKGI